MVNWMALIVVLASVLAFLRLPVSAIAGGMIRKEVAPSKELRPSVEKHLAGVSAKRLFAVESIIKTTFEALPKNRAGKIPMQAIHSIARGFFSEEHGWLIKDFEFTAANVTELQDALIAREKAPELVAALVEGHRVDAGLSLSEVVAVISAMEDMILQESLSLLEGAFVLNRLSPGAAVSTEQLEDVLTSYLIVFRDGKRRNLTDVEKHEQSKKRAMTQEMDWQNEVDFVREVVKESAGTKETYSYEIVEKVVKDVALAYGKWQNSECDEMKQTLLGLAEDASGRVSLDRFRNEEAHTHYTFAETPEYLRQIGAMEEVEGSEPKVLVANYLLGTSNCIGSSKYVSVCCLSECENLLNALHGKVQSSEVSVQVLLDTVKGMSSSSVTSPRELPEDLTEKARQIAGRYQGFVQLHSVDFKHWLHYAFPNECPLPTAIEDAAEAAEGAAVESWLGKGRVPEWQRGVEEL